MQLIIWHLRSKTRLETSEPAFEWAFFQVWDPKQSLSEVVLFWKDSASLG